MKIMWKIWKLSLAEQFFIYGVMLVSALFGIGMVAIITWWSKDSYIIVGSLLAWVVWLAIFIFWGAFAFERQFSLAIAMGLTRKEFLCSRYVVQVINTLLSIVLFAGIHAAEVQLGKSLYRGIPCEFDVGSIILDIRIILIMLMVIPAYYFFSGMLLLKFQRKALWGLWGVWIGGNSIFTAIVNFIEKNPESMFTRTIKEIAGFVINIEAVGQIGIVLIISLILLTTASIVLRKQAVTQI